MHRAFIIIAGAFLCISWLTAGCSRVELPQAPTMAEWDKFNYQKVAGPKSRMFDVTFRLSFDKARKNLHGRTLLNLQDRQRYYFVDFSGQGIRLGKVENGLETGIGSLRKWERMPYDGCDILIKRRETGIVVAVDNIVYIRAYDDTYSYGDLACGAVDNSASFQEFRIQRTGEIYFAEDFMRAEYDQGPWEPVSGSWRVNAIQTPSLSSNAFYFIGSAANGRGSCLAGQWFWDNYAFGVSCRPLDSSPVGVYFYYRDANNYFLVKWGAAKSELPKLQLIKRYNGVDTLLAQKDGGFQTGQWYHLEAKVFGTTASVSVDNTHMFTVEDRALCCGKIGLAVEGRTGAEFDDVQVRSVKEFREDFSKYIAGRWVQLGGDWRLVTDSEGRHSFAVSAKKCVAKATAGESDWHDYTASAAVGPWGKGAVGLCFYYQDEQNFYLFKWDDEKCALSKMVEGKEDILASDDAPPRTSPEHHIRIQNDGGHITVEADGSPVFEVWDDSLDEGKIALYAERAPSALFGDICVEFRTEKLAMMTVHEAFSREKSMEDWASDQSDWLARSDIIGNGVGETCWHKADFFGDVDIEVKKIPLPSKESIFRLLVAGDGQFAKSGYAFELSAKDGLKASLYRGTELVNEKAIHVEDEIHDIRFRKAGRYVAGFVAKSCVVSYCDPDPLSGTKVGWSALALPVKRKDVEVYSDNVFNYTFRRAPADWRVGAGTWEVASRWECDPRWSFFSGKSSSGVAAIWNKRLFEGDVALEFYGAIKMDQQRGRRYEYASDLNITLCADGGDLTSGYSFLFGGWRNTRTAIVKGDKAVAEKFFRIPTEMNIHREWFYLKAIKKGNLLEFWIDNKPILSYTDPSPLKGDHVAIWTYRNGIMVSRVRISSASGNKMESPFMPFPWKCSCVYDVVKR